MLENWSTAGPPAGATKSVTFGTSADRDREHEYLTHFLAEVEKAVTAHLHNDPAPLVLAGVEHEIAIYRHLSRYRQTLEQPVLGSPDGMSDTELHEKAMQVVLQSPSELLQNALADFGSRRHRTASPPMPATAIQAARLGRVMDFLIAENAENWGIWNAETQDVSTGSKRRRAAECRGATNLAARRPRLRSEGAGHAGSGRGRGGSSVLRRAIRNPV